VDRPSNDATRPDSRDADWPTEAFTLIDRAELRRVIERARNTRQAARQLRSVAGGIRHLVAATVAETRELRASVRGDRARNGSV
jgi:hypothetical protein